MENQYQERVTNRYDLDTMRKISERADARLRQCPIGSLYPAPFKVKGKPSILKVIQKGLESLV